MNRSQIEGIVRWAIGIAVTWCTAKGWLPAGMGADVIAAGVLLATIGWSWYTNKTTVMIAAVAQSDSVQKIVTTPEISKADPSPKVVSTGTAVAGPIPPQEIPTK